MEKNMYINSAAVITFIEPSQCGTVELIGMPPFTKPVRAEVHFQQSLNGRIFRQSGGLPMGGKASAGLANLYCCTIESAYIDKFVNTNRMEEAKSRFNTWRYIDDMLGFGERKWEEIEQVQPPVPRPQKQFS